MPDSPGSDDSVVTVINVDLQIRDDQRYIQLEKARRELLSAHYKLAIDTIRQIGNYSGRWHSTDSSEEKKEIETAIVEKVLIKYIHEVNDLVGNHHKDFNYDNRIQKYIALWSENIAKMIKDSGGNMQIVIEPSPQGGPNAEPVVPKTIQEALRAFRQNFGRNIILEKFEDYDVKPSFLTRVLKEEPDEKGRKAGESKVFERYKEILIADLDSQKLLLEGFFADGIEDLDPNFKWRLDLLEDSYQENMDMCIHSRDLLTMNFAKKYGHTKFFFLNPLDKICSNSGKKRLEYLGFVEAGLPEPEMQEIWNEAMKKMDDNKEYVKNRRYKPVSLDY